MRIRSAHAHESSRIAEIHAQTAIAAYAHIFPDQPFPRAETETRWREFAGQILVAVDDEIIVGFVAFDARELHALYVLPSHQGGGVGARLLEKAGEVKLLWVLRENHDARRFYEAQGWMADGQERSAFGVIEILYCR